MKTDIDDTTVTNVATITTRTELMDLLSEAAEIEHSLACQYLYAAFSLKQPGDPGLTPDQAAMVTRWFDRIVHTIATQEMLHLALANNMLTAIGGAPYLVRPNFPQWDKLYSVGLDSVLTPFSVETLERFMCWEKPQWPGPWDAACQQRSMMLPAQAAALQATDSLNPDAYPYTTIAGLYDLIRAAFESSDQNALFIGAPDDQVGESYVPFVPTLHRVTDIPSAVAAIDLIVVEGEGTPSPDPENCHYGWFRDIRDELVAELAKDPSFEPAWPCVDNPLYDVHHDNTTPGATLVTAPVTREVGELFTASYDVLLTILMRLFDADGESHDERRTLAAAAVALMRTVITPLGVALARMPANDLDPPSPTAGASFELFRDVQPLPHREPAWIYLRERLAEIASACLATGAKPGTPDCLDDCADMLRFWSDRLVLEGGAR